MLYAELQVDGRAVRLREDWSHIWAHDPESSYGHDAEALIKKLLEYLRSADAAAVTHIAERFVETSSLAIFWSRLFLVATERNDALIDILLRSEEHTSELQSLMRISYAVFCLKQKNTH